MIIARSPLRISIGGGGTDLPSYYEQFGCTFISAAINKYIYISVHKTFIDEIILKYSEMEKVMSPGEIRHPIMRTVLQDFGIDRSIEICSFADIPAGTGLGSSGAFTVALLKAVSTFQNMAFTNPELAERACEIEIEKLKSPIGKQDQYISAVGGLTEFEIDRQGKVTHRPLDMTDADRLDLEDHLLLFFTGYSRSANEILGEQDTKTKQADQKVSSEMIENLHFTRELGQRIGKALRGGHLNEFGALMNEHWQHKKKRSSKMTNGPIDNLYELALQNGALGGKLIGAGGGGFLMFLTEDKRRLRRMFLEKGLREVPFRFDQLGVQVVQNG